jgi:hypothetical protein
MKELRCRPVSLTDARTGQRVRVSAFAPGAALVPVCKPLPILGYWPRRVGDRTRLSVYVPGTMPLALRTAVEEGRTGEETWLTATKGGIQEIDLTDSREAFELLLPLASEETTHAQAA